MTGRAVWLVMACVFLTGSMPASSQTETAKKPEAPGTIRGRITAADTGRPLRRATVNLRPDTAQVQRPTLTVSTNAQGAFEMTTVPPGSYFVSAARAGYIEVQYGQRRPRERGLAVEVRAGEVTARTDIALPKAGVLAGRLVDELGLAYPGVMVVALEVRYQLGQRVPFPAGQPSTTDDLGQYRISGLQPGRYQVMAMPTESWRNEKKETLGYGATFFPGTTNPQLAQAIDLGVSEQRLDADIALAAHRTVRVGGRVLGPTGQPLAGEAVMLARTFGQGLISTTGTVRTRTAADGSFEFKDVAPAAYMVRSGASAVGSASVTVTVDDADVGNLLLVPRTGSTVSGTIVTDEGATPPFPVGAVRVNLIAQADAPVLPTVRVPAVEADWSLRMANVGGPFLIRLVNLPDSWMLDAVRLGERDITDTPWDVPTGGLEITDLQIVITDKVGSVSGSVSGPDGEPTRDAAIVVFSDDPAHWLAGSRFVRSTRPTADGTFTISGLPAGNYLAVAHDSVMDGEWESAEFLKRAADNAVRVALSSGGSETVALKVSPR
jgi:hypothetical protein